MAYVCRSGVAAYLRHATFPTMRKPAIAQHLSMLLHGWLPYLSLWDNLCCSWRVFVGAGSFCESASRLPMPARKKGWDSMSQPFLHGVCIVRASSPNDGAGMEPRPYMNYFTNTLSFARSASRSVKLKQAWLYAHLTSTFLPLTMYMPPLVIVRTRRPLRS